MLHGFFKQTSLMLRGLGNTQKKGKNLALRHMEHVKMNGGEAGIFTKGADLEDGSFLKSFSFPRSLFLNNEHF